MLWYDDMQNKNKMERMLMKIEKQKKFPLKKFIASLKKLVKPSYLRAMWPVAGISIIFFALVTILSLLNMRILTSLGMATMMIMYGMTSPLAVVFSILEMLVILAVIVALSFYYSFYNVGVQFTYQDKLAHPEQPVSAGSIWMHYKHLRKGQIWRIALYTGLFTFLWSLPLDIIAGLVTGFMPNTAGIIIAEVIRVLNYIVMIWKGLEYSQAYFLYRDKQPQFLGQSMRHALTASRRYMTGRKWNLFVIALVVDILPIAIWSLIFGGLAYYGIYSATYVLTYVGIILLVIGIACYLPVVYATAALYYSQTQESTDLDTMFKDTFKPVAELTGEAYVHEVYVEKKKDDQPSPTVKRDEKTKREAKKDE